MVRREWCAFVMVLYFVLGFFVASQWDSSSSKTVYVDRPTPTTTTTAPRTTTTTTQQPVAITTTCETSSSGSSIRFIRQGSHIVSIIENAKECP